MTDPDVEREIEANRQREIDVENAAEDDGPIIDTAERILDPFVEPMADDEIDDNDETVLDPDDAVRNDADQRPG